MFWRKKKQVEVAVEISPASTGAADIGTAPVASAGATPAGVKVDTGKVEKLPGPKMIPELVGNHLIKEMGKDAGWVWRLSVVMRPRGGGGKGQDIRIFASHEAEAKRVKVKNYMSLDEHPELIIFEGWFDKDKKKVELEEKRVMPKITIYTEKEIQQQIEAMTKPGSKIHFYLAASPASGGPLERGAAVVELNPKYPAKGQKKYSLSAISVEGTELTSKGFKMFDSDKPKDIARWIKERHFKAAGY